MSFWKWQGVTIPSIWLGIVNALNKTDGGPKAVEMLAKLMEIYPIKFK